MSEERTGCPRQRAQGSRRRNHPDGGDEVGESYLLRHMKKMNIVVNGEVTERPKVLAC